MFINIINLYQCKIIQAKYSEISEYRSLAANQRFGKLLC